MDGVARVATAFFGEAACEEGVVYESLNYASVNRLPVLFVCENNFYSTESPLRMRQPEGTQLCERARAFKIAAEKVDGNDVAAVREAARHAVEAIRGGSGPFFLECETYRWREHVGPMFDHELGRTYRTKEEVEAWMKRCPVARQARKLIGKGFATDSEIQRWQQVIHQEMLQAVTEAKAAPWPPPATLFENVY
jgi:pyruvate dehydrogenase E1 component alpha subunit